MHDGDRDALLLEFRSDAVEEVGQRRLAGAVDRRHGLGQVSRQRRHPHHVPPPPRPHQRQQGQNRGQRARQVGVDDLLGVLRSRAPHRCVPPAHPGIGNDDVEATASLVEGDDGGCAGDVVGDVDGDGVGSATGGADDLDEALQLVDASRAQPDVVSPPAQLGRQGRADPGGGPGQEDFGRGTGRCGRGRHGTIRIEGWTNAGGFDDVRGSSNRSREGGQLSGDRLGWKAWFDHRGRFLQPRVVSSPTPVGVVPEQLLDRRKIMSDTPQQDLSQLEMAFAADAKAFVALTNAYLKLGRFMEAMVVCKKGIKALPDSVDGRLLLGRVYAEQGKIPKALEEVKALLATNPDVAEAHFFAGQLHEKAGRFEDAIEAFKEAIRKDRGHDGAKAALKAKGIDFQAGPSPQELAQQAAEEEAAAAAAAAEALRLDAEAQVAAAESAALDAARAQAAQLAQAAKARAMGSAIDHMGVPGAPVGGAARTTQSIPPTVDPAFAAAYAQNLYGYPGPQAQGGGRRLSAGFTFGLFALLLMIFVGVFFGLKTHKANQDLIKELLKEQQVLVKKDTTRGHKKALEKLEAALKLDEDQTLAVSQYAYSLAVLADRGVKESDDKVAPAVAAAQKKAKNHPLSVAAQMIMLRRSGDAAGAESLGRSLGDPKQIPVAPRVELGNALAAQGKISEMVAIADTLADASDPAAFTFAGSAYRRIGDTFKARRALDNAIKTELDHDPSRALRALLILEADDVVNLPIALDDVTTLIDLGKDALGARQLGYATLGRALISKRVRSGDRESGRDIEAARLLLRNDPEMPLFEAKQAKDEKRYDDAKKLLDDAAKLDPYRLSPYLTLIEVGARAKKFDIADKAYDDALKIFGDNLELGLARGGRLLAEQKADEALAHLKKMLTTLDLAEVHRDIGKVYMLRRDFPAAVASLKKAAEKAAVRGPGIQANVYTWLGRALAQAEDHAQAKGAYEQALAATSEFPATHYWLGVSLAALGEEAAAKDEVAKYLRAEPNGPHAEDARRRASGSPPAE